jgi:hypothetical protein
MGRGRRPRRSSPMKKMGEEGTDIAGRQRMELDGRMVNDTSAKEASWMRESA